MKMNRLIWALCLVGCSGGKTSLLTSDPALGITDYRITEGENTLEIDALDANEKTIGQLNLFRGTIVLADDGRTVNGRRMTVAFQGQNVTHESEGSSLLTLPLDQEDTMNSFLLDVSPALFAWGVSFDASSTRPPAAQAGVPTERGYDTCNYDPGKSCSLLSCVSQLINAYDCSDSPLEHEYVCCNVAGAPTAFSRDCTYYGDPYNPCGTTGPNGCAVCWSRGCATSCTTIDPFESRHVYSSCAGAYFWQDAVSYTCD